MEISGHKSKGGLLKTSETFQTLATRKKNLANIDQVYWRREHSHCSAQSQPHKQKRTIRVAQLKMSVDGKSEQNGKMCNPSSVKR